MCWFAFREDQKYLKSVCKTLDENYTDFEYIEKAFVPKGWVGNEFVLTALCHIVSFYHISFLVNIYSSCILKGEMADQDPSHLFKYVLETCPEA